MTDVLETLERNAATKQQTRDKAATVYKRLLTNPPPDMAKQLADAQAALGKSDDDVRADLEIIRQAAELREEIIPAKDRADREPADEAAALEKINAECKREILEYIDSIGIEATDRLTLLIKLRCTTAFGERRIHYQSRGSALAHYRHLQHELNQLVREHPELIDDDD